MAIQMNTQLNNSITSSLNSQKSLLQQRLQQQTTENSSQTSNPQGSTVVSISSEGQSLAMRERLNEQAGAQSAPYSKGTPSKTQATMALGTPNRFDYSLFNS